MSAWAAMAAPGRAWAQTSAGATQVWRILVLRVDFPAEDPDELTTSGTGQFDLRSLAEALPAYESPYDTPPHDRAFYETHMAALARYYDTVSEGRVRLEAEVYPRDLQAAYRLPGSALSYGNGRTTEEIGERWIRLLADAVSQAEADADGPTFGDFDSYLVIHAGLGHETGQLNDIRSVYLSPGDMTAYNGGPLPADDGLHAIRDAWIMPEAIHDGGRAGLNGLLAKFFGHQLGLPGLSNFADGVPALGGWSLMDIGANRLGFLLQADQLAPGFGFVPPHPMAWTKTRLGWIEPLVVRRDTTVVVLASDRRAAEYGDLPKAVRVELSEGEYLLLENRQQRSVADLPPGVEAPYQGIELSWISPDEVTFSHTIAAGESEADSLLGRGAGVWQAVTEYDAFIPGSGILVWHVDEAVIAAHEAAGAINNERERQGIWLVEADGERDIGNFYFDRQDRTEGTRGDAFYQGVSSGESGVAALGPARLNAGGPPDTDTNTGLDTGVSVEVLSAPGDTMTVRISFARSLSGYPAPIAGGRRVQALDAGPDGLARLLVEDETGLYLLAGGQTRALGPAEARWLAAAPGADPLVYTAASDGIQAWRAAAPATPHWTAPVESGPADSGPVAALYAADLTDMWPGPVLALAEGDGLRVLAADTGEEVTRVAGAYTGLTLADVDGDGALDLVATGADGGHRIAATGSVPLWSDPSGEGGPVLAPVAGDLDGDGRAEVVTAHASGAIYLHGAGETRLLTRAESLVAGLALGDVDGDGRLEIALSTAGNVDLQRANGLSLAGFPATPPAQYELGAVTTGPALVDVDGDGRQEVTAGTARGLLCLGGDGALLEGFPLLAPEPLVGTPVAADLDGDGDLDLAALSSGLVHAWSPAALSPVYVGRTADWAQAGRDAAGTHSYPGQPTSAPPDPDGPLLVAGSAYCWPNPVGSGDAAHVRYRVSAAATASVQVYDALGDRVGRVRAEAPAAGEYEISWPVDGYASGLYLVRLKVRGADGASAQTAIRMAVAR